MAEERAKIVAHVRNTGLDSYLTVNGQVIDNVNSVYVTRFDDEENAEVHLSVLMKDVEVVEEAENRVEA